MVIPMLRFFDRNMDYGLILAVVTLMVIGILMIHSASSGEHLEYSNFWIKQLLWVIISLCFMFAVAHIPQKYIYAFSYVFFAFGIILLVLTDLFGSVAGGSERWLRLVGVRFQPSEFMKIATILALARYISFKKNKPTLYRKCIIPFIIILFPALLVLKQPDLGSALVFFAVFLPILYWEGLDKVRLFFIIAPILSAVLAAPFIPFFSWITWVILMFVVLAVLYYSRLHYIAMIIILFINILAGVVTPVVFNHLKPYQQKRITSLINPEEDPQGSG
jgi:rod shape determining protein RodA